MTIQPERAVDGALARGQISASLPYIEKQAVQLLKANYTSNAENRRSPGHCVPEEPYTRGVRRLP